MQALSSCLSEGLWMEVSSLLKKKKQVCIKVEKKTKKQKKTSLYKSRKKSVTEELWSVCGWTQGLHSSSQVKSSQAKLFYIQNGNYKHKCSKQGKY